MHQLIGPPIRIPSSRPGRVGSDRGAAGIPVGPVPIAAPHALHQEMTTCPDRTRAPTAATPNLARVPAGDLMGELLNRGLIQGFITTSTDEGRPEPAEAPAIESIYTEVLAQELERRGWECFPPDA